MMPGTRLRAFGLLVLGLAIASALPAQVVLTTMYSFCTASGPNCPDGESPYAGLAQGFDGRMYGTTYQGGPYGGGTIFKLNSVGSLTTLYGFCKASGCTDGELAYAGLTLAPNGTFYGTTQGGGTNNFGTVFSFTPSTGLTTLYNFCSASSCADGGYPFAGLFLATNGMFYGTTYTGGGSNSQGTVYQISSSGAFTALGEFCTALECPDGSSAIGGVIQDSIGNLYGTTFCGAGAGYTQGLGNAGTIWELPAGGQITTLYSFCPSAGCPGGFGPRARLVLGSDGNFYGSTFLSGPPSGNYGTIYKITPSGSLTNLYNFCTVSGCPDGANPIGALIQANDGNFYGTTKFGGTNNGGTVFQITPGGTLTTLYSFCAQAECADGQAPYGALVQGTDGDLYGTTYQGGAAGKGTLFRLSVGLSPFVETLPASAAVGSTVQILGTKLTGATSVTFNGTAAAFTVVSGYQITATVPTGATSGVVQVTTPSRTLSGNVPFQVLAGGAVAAAPKRAGGMLSGRR